MTFLRQTANRRVKCLDSNRAPRLSLSPPALGLGAALPSAIKWSTAVLAAPANTAQPPWIDALGWECPAHISSQHASNGSSRGSSTRTESSSALFYFIDIPSCPSLCETRCSISPQLVSVSARGVLHQASEAAQPLRDYAEDLSIRLPLRVFQVDTTTPAIPPHSFDIRVFRWTGTHSRPSFLNTHLVGD
ncbi:hypothetical protein M432DRAFT_390132 [Thermoascus aurantiacus ATCC 26904]